VGKQIHETQQIYQGNHTTVFIYMIAANKLYMFMSVIFYE